jgi:pyruvate carboxylase
MLRDANGNGAMNMSRWLVPTRSSTAAAAAAAATELPYHLVVGLPALSPTMASGTLAEWYLKEGDSFSAGDGLAKIETDKAAMDFEAQDDGFVAKILIPAGGNDGTFLLVKVVLERRVRSANQYFYKAHDGVICNRIPTYKAT